MQPPQREDQNQHSPNYKPTNMGPPGDSSARFIANRNEALNALKADPDNQKDKCRYLYELEKEEYRYQGKYFPLGV